MRANDITHWLRAGGVGFAVLALAVSAVEVSREGSGRPVPAAAVTARNPLAVELKRCNAITPTSSSDDACERAWAENRRRFLGASRQGPAVQAAGSTQAATTGDRP